MEAVESPVRTSVQNNLMRAHCKMSTVERRSTPVDGMASLSSETGSHVDLSCVEDPTLSIPERDLPMAMNPNGNERQVPGHLLSQYSGTRVWALK